MTDENIPKSVTARLRALGHDVETTANAIHLGATDVSVVRHSKRERRVVITLDRDFITLHRQSSYPFGAIVVRTSPPVPSRVMGRIEQVLAKVNVEKHPLDLVIVTDTEIRIESGRPSS